MKKHALILGTLSGQAEAMEWLRRQDWQISACGHVKAGPGVEVADNFYQVDILDVDGVTQLAHKIGADLIYSVGSDIAMPTVAHASKALNLPHFYSLETTNILHRKVQTRQFLNDHGISVTAFRKLAKVEDIDGFNAFPAIVKPADSQGQRGVAIVNSIEEAKNHLPQSIAASKTNEAIIEEFLDGPEFSVHAFIVDSELRFMLPSDRLVWDGPAVGIPIGHVIPATTVPAQALSQLETIIRSCVQALKIQNGPLYFQMKMTSQNGPKVIEIAPRLDGCHMWRQIEHYCGVNLIAACFERLMGLPWKDPDPNRAIYPCTLSFFLQKTGEAFIPEKHSIPQNCVYKQFYYRPEETIKATNGTIEKVGYAIIDKTPAKT